MAAANYVSCVAHRKDVPVERAIGIDLPGAPATRRRYICHACIVQLYFAREYMAGVIMPELWTVEKWSKEEGREAERMAAVRRWLASNGLPARDRANPAEGAKNAS